MFRLRRVDADPHRKARGQMHPVQRALHVRQAGGGKCSDERRIGLHTKSDAVDHAVISDCRSGEHVDIGMHPRLDAMELGLAEVRDGPPDAGIDQGEDLLAGVGVSAPWEIFRLVTRASNGE